MSSHALLLALYRAWLRGAFDTWEVPPLIARLVSSPERRALLFHAFMDLATGAISPAALQERSPR